jgi:hypothetical protein
MPQPGDHLSLSWEAPYQLPLNMTQPSLDWAFHCLELSSALTGWQALRHMTQALRHVKQALRHVKQQH